MLKVKNVYESEGIRGNRFIECRDATVKKLNEVAAEISESGIDSEIDDILVPDVAKNLHKAWTIIKIMGKVNEGLVDYIIMYYFEEGIFNTLTNAEKLAFSQMTHAIADNVKSEVETNNMFSNLMDGLSNKYTASLIRNFDEVYAGTKLDVQEITTDYFDGFIEYVRNALDFIGLQDANKEIVDSIISDIQESKNRICKSIKKTTI